MSEHSMSRVSEEVNSFHVYVFGFSQDRHTKAVSHSSLVALKKSG